MADITLNTRLVLRNDTKANWDTNGTRVLLKGEPVIIWDGETPKLKIGNGTATFSALPFTFINSSEATTITNNIVNALPWVKTVNISGSGNGLANATFSNGALSITKGEFLTSHQDISGKVDKINTTAKTIGLYKVAYNAQGQITSSSSVAKADITALGIPAQDTNTTYSLTVTDDGTVRTPDVPSPVSYFEISLNGSDNTTTNFRLNKGSNISLVRGIIGLDYDYEISATDTTYTLSAGISNGQIVLTPSSGSAQTISVPGLKSAAYTESSAYATAAQGTLATNAMPKSGGAFTGAISWATAPTADAHLTNKSYVDTQINSKVASVFKFKGTKATIADLPTTGNVIGDVWHVEADHTEYVWVVVDGALNPSWEALGGAIDLSGYLLKSEIYPMTMKIGDSTWIYDPKANDSQVSSGFQLNNHLAIEAGNNITITPKKPDEDPYIKFSISATDTKVTDSANNTGSVFTGIIGGTTVSRTNVGALILTGFVASASDTGALAATDTITKALNKIYNLANSKTSNTGTVTSVVAGGGLTGGTITTTGTISHATKPASGTALTPGSGSGLTFLTGISLDSYGHVATATSATVTLPTASSLGAITTLTAGSGISVTGTGVTRTVSINTADTFILDGGSAAA